MKLKASKPLTYNTRRLQPGDVFEAKPRDGKILLASRKVSRVRDPVELEPPPADVAEQIAATVAPSPPTAEAPSQEAATSSGEVGASDEASSAGDIAALRAEYEATLGKRPFMGWDAATLREKMAAAKAP